MTKSLELMTAEQVDTVSEALHMAKWKWIDISRDESAPQTERDEARRAADVAEALYYRVEALKPQTRWQAQQRGNQARKLRA